MAYHLNFTGSRPNATEKVIRLLTMLNAINTDPWLRSRVCLHGGTAINLFALGTPRLSVDIDLNYIGQSDRQAMSGPFPRPFRVADRFAGREHEVSTSLYPMLLTGDEPTLSDLINSAEAYLANVWEPHDDAEDQYLHRAARADFAPNLLFSDYPAILAAAQQDPAATWKRRNLAKTL